MEFAIILAAQRGYLPSCDSVIRNSVEQAVLSEQAGFRTAWFAEHHFTNYSLVPSPLLMVAHCAGLTSTIRLGSAVCVLPLYRPQRLLAEIGFVDIVANGRLELGVGSGYQQFEFDRFGVNVDEAPAVFSECLDILLKGLKQKIFLRRYLRRRFQCELFKSQPRRSGLPPGPPKQCAEPIVRDTTFSLRPP